MLWKITFIGGERRRGLKAGERTCCRISLWLPSVRDIFDRDDLRRRACDLPHVRVVGIKGHGDIQLRLRFARFRVRLIGVFAFPDCLENARSVPLRKLDFLYCFRVGSAPFVGEVEKCRRCIKRVCGLSEEMVRTRTIFINILAPPSRPVMP